MLSFFQTRSIKQTTVFRGPLEIGSQLKINVYGYNRVKKRYFIIVIFLMTIYQCDQHLAMISRLFWLTVNTKSTALCGMLTVLYITTKSLNFQAALYHLFSISP